MLISSSSIWPELNLKDFGNLSKEKRLNKNKKTQIWTQNPFLNHAAQKSLVAQKLFAIAYHHDDSSKNSFALIGSNIVKVGDKIGQAEIMAIEKNTVIIRNQNGIFKITFGSQARGQNATN